MPTFSNWQTPAVQNIGFASGTATFAAVPFSAGAALIFIAADQRTPTTVTVGGAEALEIVSSTEGDVTAWQIEGLSAGDKDVVVTCATTWATVGVITCAKDSSLQTVASATAQKAFGFEGNPQAASSLTVPSGGAGAVIGYTRRDGSTFAWTVGTEKAEAFTGGIALSLSTAELSATGAPTFTVSFGDFPGSAIAALSFALMPPLGTFNKSGWFDPERSGKQEWFGLSKRKEAWFDPALIAATVAGPATRYKGAQARAVRYLGTRSDAVLDLGPTPMGWT